MPNNEQLARFQIEREGPVRSLITEIEGILDKKNQYPDTLSRYREYWEYLGGKPVQTPEALEGFVAVASGFSFRETSYFVQSVVPNRPVKQTVIAEFPLERILEMRPRHPTFWEGVQVDGKVPYVVFTQDKHHEMQGGVNPEVLAPFPDETITLYEDNTAEVQIHHPTGLLLLWPHMVADESMVFSEVPREFIRAGRVYKNYCETLRGSSQHNVNALIHIRYSLDDPNKMRPVRHELF